MDSRHLEYCHENHIPVDFVTRHIHYTIDPPERIDIAYSELDEGRGRLLPI